MYLWNNLSKKQESIQVELESSASSCRSTKPETKTINGIEYTEGESYIDLSVVLDDAERARRQTWWFKTASFFCDHLDKHPLERKFLVKLDFFLMSSSMLGYFVKYINQTNINTAYVNGMKEHYQMNGNQFNYLGTMFNIGSILGQIPSNLILHKISARYYLAGMEFIWCILTILLITPKSIKGLYGLRFVTGFLESGYLPGLEYIIGSWYNRKELCKRSAFFVCSGSAAMLVSPLIQQRILKSSWAHHTLQPFQWVFVIDFCIGLPVAFYTLFANPNTPSTTTSWYFSETDKKVALERRRRIGAQLNTREPYTYAKIKAFFKSWHIFVFPILFLAYSNACQPLYSQVTQLWVKNDLKLSSYYYNTYPTAITGGGIGLAILVSYINDFYKGRLNYPFILLMFISITFSMIVLSVWNVPIGLHWFSYFLHGMVLSSGQPLIFSWLNRLLANDDMKRNFVVVCTNTLSYVTAAWVPILTFNQLDQPKFFIGFTYTACLGALGIIMSTIALYFSLKDEKSDRTVIGADLYDENTILNSQKQQ